MEQKELSLEEMKDVYKNYINDLCKQFKLIEKRDFSEKIAKHIMNRPSDIQNNEVKIQDWNEEFYTYVVKYSTYSIDELNKLFSIDMNLLISKTGINNGN